MKLVDLNRIVAQSQCAFQSISDFPFIEFKHISKTLDFILLKSVPHTMKKKINKKREKKNKKSVLPCHSRVKLMLEKPYMVFTLCLWSKSSIYFTPNLLPFDGEYI